MSAATSFLGATWTARPYEPARAGAIAQEHGLSPTAARCMAIRWPTPRDRVLTPSRDHLLDPYTMHRMDEAISCLQATGERGGRIRIVTDYDVDGTTSSLLLQAAMGVRWPDAHIDYHIPDRFTEGYGFSVAAAQAAARDGVEMIVTADIGVRDHAAIEAATDAGLQVLVADHHLPAGEAVPDRGIILCPPQRDCSYENPALAACGVSLKLGQALLSGHRHESKTVRSMLKLSAIGTVADMVDLRTPENRAIVRLGLDALNEDRHQAGLQALLKVSGCTPGNIEASDIGFRIGPRINAAGRLTHAAHVIELLRCRDPNRAAVLAAELDQVNRERQRLQRALSSQCLAQLGSPPRAFVVVSGPEHEGFHRGIVGIVASRLKDKTRRPVAVVSIQGALAVGSIRSVPGLHAVEALDSVSDLLVKYGGHPAAAGFTLHAQHLDAFAQRLAAWAEARQGQEPPPHEVAFDTTVTPADLTERLYRELQQLGPYGQGNPAPTLVVQGVQAHRIQPLGKDQKHLRFQLSTPHGPLKAIWWNGATYQRALGSGPLDLMGQLEHNHYRGVTTLQFNATDARPSTP